MPTSPNKGYTQPTYNTEVGTWGTDINTNLTGIIDSNLGGTTSVSLSNSNVTLTSTQAQNLTIYLTGTLLTNVTVYSPNIGFCWIVNNTTGSYTVTYQSNFGSGVVGSAITLPQGVRSVITSDTVNGATLGAINVAPASSLPGFGAPTSIAAAATTDIGTAANLFALVTGTGVTITSFGSSATTTSPIYLIKFNATNTITYNATSLITPGAANIQVLAGSFAIAQYLGSGNWQIISYTPNTSINTVQTFTTGSGTYTPTFGAVKSRVRINGAGGGGGGIGLGYGTGGTGGDTSFGSWTAKGGVGGGGSGSGGGLGGSGGSGGANGTGTLVRRMSGQAGMAGVGYALGGSGGSSGLGFGAPVNGATAAGVAGVGYGAGGSGGSTNSPGTAGAAGGGGGEHVEFWIFNPSATSYSVGAAGTTGSGAYAGGAGTSGAIIIEEFYA